MEGSTKERSEEPFQRRESSERVAGKVVPEDIREKRDNTESHTQHQGTRAASSLKNSLFRLSFLSRIHSFTQRRSTTRTKERTSFSLSFPFPFPPWGCMCVKWTNQKTTLQTMLHIKIHAPPSGNNTCTKKQKPISREKKNTHFFFSQPRH